MRLKLILLPCLALSACVPTSRTEYPGAVYAGGTAEAYGTKAAQPDTFHTTVPMRVIANPSGAYLVHLVDHTPPLHVQIAVVKSSTGCEVKPNPRLNIGVQPDLDGGKMVAKRFELKCPSWSPLAQ